jgi:hypothetical protein
VRLSLVFGEKGGTARPVAAVAPPALNFHVGYDASEERMVKIISAWITDPTTGVPI